MLNLRVLGHAGPNHECGTARRIRQMPDEVFIVDGGSPYRYLYRPEKRVCLHSQWRSSETDRRAEYHAIIDDGRAKRRAETDRWRNLSTAPGAPPGAERLVFARVSTGETDAPPG